MKVCELKDELLDYWVARADNAAEVHVIDSHWCNHTRWELPSLVQGGDMKEGITSAIA